MKIKGNKKDNTLVGSDENDKIQGLGGDDTITAKGGHDTVDAGSGDDRITIAADTSADVDAGKGSDTVKISAGALGSSINLGAGDDSVDIRESIQTDQNFSIAGGQGSNSVNFALAQEAYSVTENGDNGYTVVDASGNSYSLSSISSLTFNGVPFDPEAGNPENQAPVVSSPIADQAYNENTAFSFQFAASTFTDADGDPLTYTATLSDGAALPTWLAFDAASRTFSGTAPNDGAAISVSVTASDGVDAVTDTFNITVNNVPTFHERWVAADAAYTAVQGQPNGNVALFGGYSEAAPYNGTTLGQAALAANNAFLDLAASYIAYLESGGEALTDIIVKSGPSRSQSLHDNILGNVALASLDQRDLDTPANLARFGEWVNRGWVSGYTSDTAATLRGVAFDFEHEVNRDDYHSFDVTANDADLTDAQTDPDGTLLNNGTPGEHFHVTTFNAAGISMGLAAHKYGDVYADGYVNGTTYTVEDGYSSSGTRAHWSFAMTVEDGLNGSTLDVGSASVKGDYDVGLWIDIDPSSTDQMVFLTNVEEIPDSFTPDSDIFQNSWNINFANIKSQLLNNYGVNYAPGAEFSIELRLTEVGSGDVVMTNHIDVLVA